MTRQRQDDKSTEFGLWLRGQLPEQKTSVRSISSRQDKWSKGYDAQNLDYIWLQYFEDNVMLLEEKRHGAYQRGNQKETHSIIDQALTYACRAKYAFKRWRGNPRGLNYHGYHVITFEHTNPEDGWTKIDGREVTTEQLLAFLRFEEI